MIQLITDIPALQFIIFESTHYNTLILMNTIMEPAEV